MSRAMGPESSPDAERLRAMAERQGGISEKWKNSPSGLSAMGFGRVTRGPLPRNPELEAMAAGKKRGQ